MDLMNQIRKSIDESNEIVYAFGSPHGVLGF